MICGIGIGADLEQGADEGEWAVVDRILKAGPDCQGHRTIGHAIRFIARCP
jgi:hypothetical protein